MGSQNSAEQELNDWINWIIDRSFYDTNMDFNYRHLSFSEKRTIDISIIRIMETKRRIQTKILALNDPDILNPLKY